MRPIGRLLAIGTLAGTLVAGSGLPSSAGFAVYGWAVARQPTTHHYSPAPRDRKNAVGGAVHVTRLAKGVYLVKFVHGTNGSTLGVAHVTPLGTAPRICNMDTWGWGVNPPGYDENVQVRCFDLAGHVADSRFVVDFVGIGNGGQYAWMYGYQVSSDYDVDAGSSYDSASGTVHVHHAGTGSYQVTLAGQGGEDGNVQVVSDTYKGTCRVLEWGTDSTDQVIGLACRDRHGNPLDQTFNLTFVNGIGLRGYSAGKAAYLWADQPTASSYLPRSEWRWSSSGSGPRVTRSGPGTYTVHMIGISGRGGSAQVTAYGNTTKRCQLSSIPTTGTTQTVGVRCFRQDGSLADSKFSFVFTR